MIIGNLEETKDTDEDTDEKDENMKDEVKDDNEWKVKGDLFWKLHKHYRTVDLIVKFPKQISRSH